MNKLLTENEKMMYRLAGIKLNEADSTNPFSLAVDEADKARAKEKTEIQELQARVETLAAEIKSLAVRK